MNYTEKVYVDLIANGINDCDFKVDFTQVIVKDLMKLCAAHRTVGLAYLGMKKLDNVPDKLLEQFEIGFTMEVTEYVNNKRFIEKVAEALSRESIKHIIVKGITIAQYYPEEELRKAGDLDLLIDPNHKVKVRNILIDMGATYEYESSDENTDLFILGRDVIEVHSKIMEGVKFSSDSIYDEFSANVYENAKIISNYTYEMNLVDSYVYSVFHAAKHFYKGGCGLRMIVDLWILKKALDETQREKTINILSKMKLKSFEEKLIRLAKYWLEDRNYKDDLSNAIEEYIITGGLYGYGNVGSDASQIRKTGGGSYLISVLKWAFPSYKYMREHSQWFKDKPAILLPVAYVVRYAKKIKKRGRKKLIENIAKGKSENERHDAMLKIMELKNE